MANEIRPKEIPIYNAVIDLINEGYEPSEIKVIDISKRAGIGKGTVYEYFDSKEEAILMAVMYQLSIIFSEIDEVVNQEDNFKDMLFALMNWVDDKTGNKNCFSYCLRLYMGNIKIPEELKNKMKASHERISGEPDCGMKRIANILMSYAIEEDVYKHDDFREFTSVVISQLVLYVLFKMNGAVEVDYYDDPKEHIYRNILKLLS